MTVIKWLWGTVREATGQVERNLFLFSHTDIYSNVQPTVCVLHEIQLEKRDGSSLIASRAADSSHKEDITGIFRVRSGRTFCLALQFPYQRLPREGQLDVWSFSARRKISWVRQKRYHLTLSLNFFSFFLNSAKTQGLGREYLRIAKFDVGAGIRNH